MLRYIGKVGIVFYCSIIAFVIYVYLTYPYYLQQTDLVAFLTGAKIIKMQDTINLYDLEMQHVYQNEVVSPVVRYYLLPFRSVPLIAILYLPFVYLSLEFATTLIFLINLALIYFYYKYLSGMYKDNIGGKFLLLITIVFWPVISTLLVGQNTTINLVLSLLLFASLKKEKYLIAGLISGLFFIRPQSMLILPLIFLLIKKKFEYILGFIASAILFLGLNLLITDFSQLITYPQFVMSVESEAYGSRPSQMASLYFTTSLIFKNQNENVLMIINLLVYMLFYIRFFLLRRYLSLEKGFSIAILITLLCSVHVLSHDLILLLLPIYFYLLSAKTQLKDRDYIILILLYFSPVFSMFGMAIITTHLLLGVLLTLIFKNISHSKE